MVSTLVANVVAIAAVVGLLTGFYVYTGRIVINETTQAALHADVEVVPLDETTVKGRNAPVRAFRIDVFDNMERGLADD